MAFETLRKGISVSKTREQSSMHASLSRTVLLALFALLLQGFSMSPVHVEAAIAQNNCPNTTASFAKTFSGEWCGDSTRIADSCLGSYYRSGIFKQITVSSPSLDTVSFPCAAAFQSVTFSNISCEVSGYCWSIVNGYEYFIGFTTGYCPLDENVFAGFRPVDSTFASAVAFVGKGKFCTNNASSHLSLSFRIFSLGVIAVLSSLV
eukprot:ANDGO_03978.mRNA.1 hypothetical protein